MQLYPAIDLKGGKCVRLKQGEFDNVTVYSEEPYKIAEYFEQSGATFIHLVDLDGALAGHSVNAEVIRRIADTVSIPLELGGGIRSFRDIEEVLSLGISRIIIGTKAVSDPGFVSKAIETFGADKIVIGVDAKNGMVAVEGWEKVSDKTALSMCQHMKEIGIKTIIYTDIAKDGMLSGPNIEQTKRISDETGLDIIASGGVSCLEDLENISKQGIHGAIIGKALYEKRIDLREAVDLFQNN